MSIFGPIIGLSIVTGAWVHYLAAIGREEIPEKPTGYIAIMALGSAVAVAPFAFGLAGIFSIAIAASAWAFALGFLYLLGQAPLPDGELKVRIGDKMLDFSALDATGETFQLSELQGKRYLFKFFRGYW